MGFLYRTLKFHSPQYMISLRAAICRTYKIEVCSTHVRTSTIDPLDSAGELCCSHCSLDPRNGHRLGAHLF